MDCNNHDHFNGECLVIEWVGAETKRGEPQGATQETIEANHLKQKQLWKQEMILANQKPW